LAVGYWKKDLATARTGMPSLFLLLLLLHCAGTFLREELLVVAALVARERKHAISFQASLAQVFCSVNLKVVRNRIKNCSCFGCAFHLMTGRLEKSPK
jgi:hypothetical protein